jgi:hypothetical protein
LRCEFYLKGWFCQPEQKNFRVARQRWKQILIFFVYRSTAFTFEMQFHFSTVRGCSVSKRKWLY